MTQLRLNHISLRYPGAADPVLDDVCATFPSGWTALLGDNGIGKTTLAAIAAGRLAPDAGTVTPSGLLAAWIVQESDAEPETLGEFGADWTPEAIALRDVLGIGDDWPYRWEELSGGERKRLQIACALALRPDILVADEPTNHLDIPSRRAVIAALQRFHGVGIVVTHDTDVIGALAQRSYMLHRVHGASGIRTAVDLLEGDWQAISSQLEARDAAARERLSRAKGEVRRLQAEQARRREKVRQAAAAARRVPDRKDHDACKLKKFARGGLDGGVGRSAGQLAGRIEDARQAAGGIETAAKRYEGTVEFAIQPSSRKELMHLEPGVVRFGSSRAIPLPGACEGSGEEDGAAGAGGFVPIQPMDATAGPAAAQSGGFTPIRPMEAAMEQAEEQRRGGEERFAHAVYTGNRIEIAAVPGATGVAVPRISIGPRDHVALTGPNGAGKSTLLRALAATLDAAVPVLVMGQETEPAQALLQRFAALDGAARQATIARFAQLNGNPESLLGGDALSPGECRKLVLAMGLASGPQALVLDEPSNHLDLSSKQALAHMLQAYPGALLVATHDSLLLNALGGGC